MFSLMLNCPGYTPNPADGLDPLPRHTFPALMPGAPDLLDQFNEFSATPDREGYIDSNNIQRLAFVPQDLELDEGRYYRAAVVDTRSNYFCLVCAMQIAARITRLAAKQHTTPLCLGNMLSEVNKARYLRQMTENMRVLLVFNALFLPFAPIFAKANVNRYPARLRAICLSPSKLAPFFTDSISNPVNPELLVMGLDLNAMAEAIVIQEGGRALEPQPAPASATTPAALAAALSPTPPAPALTSRPATPPYATAAALTSIAETPEQLMREIIALITTGTAGPRTSSTRHTPSIMGKLLSAVSRSQRRGGRLHRSSLQNQRPLQLNTSEASRDDADYERYSIRSGRSFAPGLSPEGSQHAVDDQSHDSSTWERSHRETWGDWAQRQRGDFAAWWRGLNTLERLAGRFRSGPSPGAPVPPDLENGGEASPPPPGFFERHKLELFILQFSALVALIAWLILRESGEAGGIGPGPTPPPSPYGPGCNASNPNATSYLPIMFAPPSQLQVLQNQAQALNITVMFQTVVSQYSEAYNAMLRVLYEGCLDGVNFLGFINWLPGTQPIPDAAMDPTIRLTTMMMKQCFVQTVQSATQLPVNLLSNPAMYSRMTAAALQQIVQVTGLDWALYNYNTPEAQQIIEDVMNATCVLLTEGHFPQGVAGWPLPPA